MFIMISIGQLCKESSGFDNKLTLDYVRLLSYLNNVAAVPKSRYSSSHKKYKQYKKLYIRNKKYKNSCYGILSFICKNF